MTGDLLITASLLVILAALAAAHLVVSMREGRR